MIEMPLTTIEKYTKTEREREKNLIHTKSCGGLSKSRNRNEWHGMKNGENRINWILNVRRIEFGYSVFDLATLVQFFFFFFFFFNETMLFAFSIWEKENERNNLP